MTAHAADAHAHPPTAHQSSRVSAPILGMLLFIASETMLFGAFFTAYFFARVVNPDAVGSWPPEGYHLPVFVAGVNTAILLTSSFTMHWALQSIKRGNRAGLQAGLVLTLAMGGTFLATQILEYSRIGFAWLRGWWRRTIGSPTPCGRFTSRGSTSGSKGGRPCPRASGSSDGSPRIWT